MPNVGSKEAEQGPGSRLGLSRERIVLAALDLLDSDGLDGFSMRRLADRLGVGTMTVYGYFRSKDELLDAAVDAAAEEIAPAQLTGPWKVRLRQLFVAVHRALLERPAVVELRLRRPIVGRGALALTEVGLGILREAGFGDREAARAYRVLFVHAFGFAAFGPGGRSRDDGDRAAKALTSLPADSYPILAGSAVQFGEVMNDPTLFELGLDALLEGLEATLPDTSAPPSG